MDASTTAGNAGRSEIPVSCLKWTDSHGRHEMYPLLARETIVGRRSDADLILVERNVSRRHVRIVQEEDGFTLYDLESSHGTYVNGQRIDQCAHASRVSLNRRS